MYLPKISIIIPVKNAAATVQKTLDSIRKQNYKNLECIVIDSLSTDGTVEIIEKNQDIINIFISEEDKSGAEASNKGIKVATGDLIGFLYADDYLESNALYELSSAYIYNSSCNIFSFGLSVEELYSKKIIMESRDKKNINLNLNNIFFKHVLNHFYSPRIFDKYGGYEHLFYDGTTFVANDREFMIRLALNDEKNFVIEKTLYRMTAHKNSYTGSRRNIVKIRYEHVAIAEKYLLNENLSSYKKNKLIDFKSHNLSLLLVYYFYKLDFKNFYKIFLDGYQLKNFYWLFDIIKCPISEISYRMSVKKWL